MQIFLSSGHTYPASIGGKASCRIHDYLAKGLSELGHDVFYKLRAINQPLPGDIQAVSEVKYDADILHLDYPIHQTVESRGRPWVRTYHAPNYGVPSIYPYIKRNWIFVSRTHAKSFGKKRYVYNGIDPAEFYFSETKADYFLFVVSGLERALSKGLDIVLSLKEKLGFKLVIAGASQDLAVEHYFKTMCQAKGIVFAGEIYGTQKAELFAGARAVFFPTRLNEPFGLVMAEALMSGTPVICSAYGACQELINSEVGFICHQESDYVNAINQIHTISPMHCRDKSLEAFHYIKMAENYIKEYEKQL